MARTPVPESGCSGDPQVTSGGTPAQRDAHPLRAGRSSGILSPRECDEACFAWRGARPRGDGGLGRGDGAGLERRAARRIRSAAGLTRLQVKVTRVLASRRPAMSSRVRIRVRRSAPSLSCWRRSRAPQRRWGHSCDPPKGPAALQVLVDATSKLAQSDAQAATVFSLVTPGSHRRLLLAMHAPPGAPCRTPCATLRTAEDHDTRTRSSHRADARTTHAGRAWPSCG